MGNKKNRPHLHNNTHRHVYVKKKISKIMKKKRSIPIHHNAEGSRIINMHKLQEYLGELNTHSAQCEGSVLLSGETRDGLASVLSSHCSTCGHRITLQTSEKVKDPHGYRRWECNLAAVWGKMVTGGGHSQL